MLMPVFRQKLNRKRVARDGKPNPLTPKILLLHLVMLPSKLILVYAGTG